MIAPAAIYLHFIFSFLNLALELYQKNYISTLSSKHCSFPHFQANFGQFQLLRGLSEAYKVFLKLILRFSYPQKVITFFFKDP